MQSVAKLITHSKGVSLCRRARSKVLLKLFVCWGCPQLLTCAEPGNVGGLQTATMVGSLTASMRSEQLHPPAPAREAMTGPRTQSQRLPSVPGVLGWALVSPGNLCHPKMQTEYQAAPQSVIRNVG